MASQNVNRVLRAFPTTKPNGFGIGLAICRSIVEGARRTRAGVSNAERKMTFQLAIQT